MRWARPVRRDPAGDDPARLLGLSDHRAGRDSSAPDGAGPARCGRLPSPRDRAAQGASAEATPEMRSTVLGISDDRALGSSLRLIVTNPALLLAAKAAVDDVVKAIAPAASRFREASELSRLNTSPAQEVTISPLLAQAIAAALRGAELTGGAVDPTIGSAIWLAGHHTDFGSVSGDGGAVPLIAHPI